MINDEVKFMIMLVGIGVVSIILTFLGMRGIFEKNKKFDYKDQNFLICGIMGDILFLGAIIFYSFYFMGISLISKNNFSMYETFGIVITLFVTGLHGVLNCKDYRKDVLFYRIFTYQIGLSAIGIIGITLYLFLWGWPK
ncbi:MAG: hypothetical protein HY209_02355 [Candidatus Omnitrophica bacterium]|nr:hypothetical protein [Candidatus Omnitrophota bacterium]